LRWHKVVVPGSTHSIRVSVASSHLVFGAALLSGAAWQQGPRPRSCVWSQFSFSQLLSPDLKGKVSVYSMR